MPVQRSRPELGSHFEHGGSVTPEHTEPVTTSPAIGGAVRSGGRRCGFRTLTGERLFV